MHHRRRHCRRLLYRGAGLALLAPLLLGSGLISGGGGGGGTPGTGDIEQVFSCTTGPCTNITVDTGQSLGVTGSGTIAATTAVALAANPTDCAVNTFANAIAANGNLTCAAATVGDADDDATTKGVVTFLNSEFDCVAGLCNHATGGITDSMLANNYSGVGACAANTWASTLNDNAAPTCTQPAFTNISGSVTDAQVPNTITVDLATVATTANAGDSATAFFTVGELERTLMPAASGDCAASNWAKGIDADLVLDCSQPAFTNISGSVTDAQVPDSITVTLAATATALAADPADCTANQYANAIAASGNLTCSAVNFSQLAGTASAAQIPAATADCAAGMFAKGIDAGMVLDCATPAGGAASNSFETWSTPAGTSPVADSATDTITLTAGTGMTITGSAGTDTVAFGLSGITDASLASNYSGVGACAANSWASTLNDNAAPTCTQPAFSNISGSVTDAQVPDGITVTLAATATALAADPSDCSANQFANAIVASGNLTCAQPNFTDLAGTASAAQEPLATLLAGRSGTGNDTTLSTSADGTLYGSTTTAMDLVLRANSADTTTGEVLVNAPLIRTPGLLQFDPDSSLARSFITYFDGTETFSGTTLMNETTNGTYTMNNSNSSFGAFLTSGTVVLDYTVAPTFASSFFFAGPKVRASTAITSRLFRPFVAAPGFDANAATLTLTDNGMFEAIPVYTITSAGVIAGSQRGFYSAATVGASATLPQWRDFVAADTAGAGTVTTHVGVDVEALSDATTSIGIRNASTTVYTNTNQAVTAVTDTIVCNSTYKTITLPSGSMSLTSNPSIANGQTGQICILQNVGANVLTLTDATKGLNLAAATRALSSDDTLTLMYGGAAADWVEIAWADN